MNNKVEVVLEFNKIKKILEKHTISPMGREKISALCPVIDKEHVKNLQGETSEGVLLINSGIELPLEGLRDIRSALKLAKLGSLLSPVELLNIASTMRAARLILSMWDKKRIEECKIIDATIKTLHSFQSLEEKITKAIVGEDEIADNASPKLSSIRRQKRKLAQSVKDKLNEIITSPHYQKALQDPIVTMRGERYVVPVKQEFKGSISGIVHDQSASGATLYIEPMPVMQMNNELKQLEIEEKQEIDRILWEFSEKINENHEYIDYTLQGLVHLDFIMAKAKYSRSIGGVAPIVNDRGHINIIQGRHPLLKGDVVPIDVHLGDDFTILVITGPNTGGKTVSLKTVGLITLMAQSGLHIPCQEGTEISVFEGVYADIGDEQSIEQNLSTFSSHMKNIKTILEVATDKCLVILDELGAGTDPQEGAALAMAMLNFFYEKGTRVIATTHYSELKTFAFSKEGLENASMEFDVRTLSPTYKLTIGIPGKSNAFEISKRLGLKAEIIEQAKSLMADENLKMEDLLRHIEEEKTKAEEETDEIVALKRSYLRKLEKLEEERKKLKAEENRILEKAREKARFTLIKTENEAHEIIEKLKDIELESERRIKDRAVESARTWLREAKKDISDSDDKSILKVHGKDLGPLKSGQKVKVAGLNQEGYIIATDDSEKTAQVQIGIMKVNVPTKSLIPIEEREYEEEKSRYTAIAMSKMKDISTEIDLRGLILDEALIKVDRYLDDAMMAGLSRVTLIHGKGTGALRRGIHDMLRKRPRIKAYRLGNIDEGGSGVTVVEL